MKTKLNADSPFKPGSPLAAGGPFKPSFGLSGAFCLVLLTLALSLPAMAQEDPSATAGSVWGGYDVRQSIEFGGRIAEVNGNGQLYSTLVNLKSGPRLFGQELSMRPMARGGGLFDTLYLSSFGFGGDPNDMARLRVEKSKWYNFVVLYRRDENYFDFNLFANPLNLNQGAGAALKTPANPAFPATSATPWLFDPTAMSWYTNSPHLQDTTRNMADFDLILFPQSPIRIRLGYARNVNQGRLDTTLEGPIQTLMTEYSQSRSDRYQFGIDLRVLRRTTISFDQFFEHDKVDPNFRDNNLSFTLTNGTPIDVGISFPARGCTIVAGVTFPGNNVYVPSGTCNGLFSFRRSGRVRTDLPTSQLSLQSNYFRKLDITASGSYSSGQSDFSNYQENINSLVNPSQITGSSHTDRVSGNADLGFTYHLTNRWSFSDKFRWLSWRDPGGFNQTTTTATTTTPAAYQTYIGERTYSNTAKLGWASSRLGAYVGYRYGRRELTGSPVGDSPTLNSYFSIGVDAQGVADGPRTTTKINENSALAGINFRPIPDWRINADIELLSADNAFTNIGPLHQQRVRLNTSYRVNRWSSINGGVHFIENRNNLSTNVNADFSPSNPNLFPTTAVAPFSSVPAAYGHKDHWRYYTLGASLHPDRFFAFDFGWTYLDQLINSATCAPVAFGAIVQSVSAFCRNDTNAPPLATLPTAATTVGLPLVQDYQERTNTGYFTLIIRPVHRVALNVGYELTSTAGHNRWLLPGGGDGTGVLQMLSDIYGNSPPLAGNATSPCPSASTAVTGGCAFPGPFPDAPLSQALNWHKPTAGVAIDVCKNVSFKGQFAFYDYNEKENHGLPLATLPRNFHANTGTLSLKYAF